MKLSTPLLTLPLLGLLAASCGDDKKKDNSKMAALAASKNLVGEFIPLAASCSDSDQTLLAAPPASQSISIILEKNQYIVRVDVETCSIDLVLDIVSIEDDLVTMKRAGARTTNTSDQCKEATEAVEKEMKLNDKLIKRRLVARGDFLYQSSITKDACFPLRKKSAASSKSSKEVPPTLAPSKPTGATPAPAPTKAYTVDEEGREKEIELSSAEGDSRYASSATKGFSSIASDTGGVVSFAPSAKQLPAVLDNVIRHIVGRSSKDRPIDIALLIDTTGSMSDDISWVKAEMGQLVKKLNDLKASGYNIALGLVLYRDSGDAYVTKIESHLTADLSAVSSAVNSIEVTGGGDEPEAVLDALMTSKEKLSWRSNSQRKAILIGDAPPQPRMCTGDHCDSAEVSRRLASAGIEIVVYPIVTSR